MAGSQQAPNLLQVASPIERAARVPAGRVPLMAFVADAETEAAVRDGLSQLGVSGAEVSRGGIARAVQYLGTERSPAVLIVDITGVDLPVSLVNQLAEVCEPGVTVLAIGQQNDVGLYRDLMQAGLTDYIVKPVTPQLLAKALSSKPGGEDGVPINQKLGKVVAFIGARGGVGTTTLAVNLAWYLANRQNRRVGILDLDMQNGDCALELGLKPTPGLREALTNPFRVDSVFLERAMAIQGERLFVLSSEEPLRDQIDFTAEAVDSLVGVLRTQFHYVIVDVPRIAIAPYRHALDTAELRVIVADQTLHAVRDAVRLRAALGQSEAGHRDLVVINRGGEGGRHAVTVDEMSNVLEVRPRTVIPYQPKLFAKSAGAGRVAVEERGEFADAIAALANEISGRPAERRGWWRFSK